MKVHIFTDKSHVSEARAELLAKGIRKRDQEMEVEIKDLAKDPISAEMTNFHTQTTDIDGVVMLNADLLLFPNTGTLSVFEKHFLDNKDSSPLAGKKYGVLMGSTTTFQGTTDTNDHFLDNRLIERLAERGMSHYPIVVEHAEDDMQIEEAGERFVEQAILGDDSLKMKSST